MDIKLKILVILFFIILFYYNFYFDNKIMKNEKNKKGIIIIGDLHGNKDALIAILKNENVIDRDNNWIPNNKLIIQLGDVIDRGTQSLETLLYLKKIQKQAKSGQVIRLIGNHEIMLLQNDFRFINKEYDTPDKITKIKNIIMDTTNNILASYSIGNKLLFSHAGFSNEIIKNYKLKKNHVTMISNVTNEILKTIVNNLERYNNSELLSDNGPFWNRKNDISFPLDILQIIGHTPKNNIHISQNKNIIYADVGMMVQNKIGYLKIINNKFVVYEGNYNNIYHRLL